MPQRKNKWEVSSALRSIMDRGDKVETVGEKITVESSKKLGIKLLGAVDFLRAKGYMVIRK